ncbi:phosphotransferase [Streptococcus pneumoniae]|uniref:Acid sugar phosphatase n=1 Tax=Streptococcus pneumoniae TaxID=1313 RepID=A0AAP5MT28_STREE|nr:HAD-IIA family hydrolase [Streptococcus pneumoniae]MDS2636789.1 HAD-IIA family hydrolase [Streptococcus pneumoniae]MDS2716534.1 HAD-IIA family hydrolase [Streptococcus pneumoniae]MDS2743153.1 HAD-IIA family hydrolase [Streptococcus pneumoniae]MDS2765656.1 HAD-IIA family hydrolase [Streptococcus pneumoniae]
MKLTNRVDYFGADISELQNKKLFLFDMDGTIYEEDRLFEGTLELLDYIHNIGGEYIFITNNSSKSVVDYVEKVNRLGIKAERDNFFTSAQATIVYIKENYPKSKVYCQGTKSLIKELSDAGIDVTEQVSADIDVVLVGFDTELTSDKIRNTCEILSTKDAPFIATNPDIRCPVSFGFIPDCGSICDMISKSVDREPVYIGKPEPTMVDIVRKKLNYSLFETVVIGDRLYTDIMTGINAGVTSVCVLTGEATVNDIQQDSIKPTYTFKNVKEMWKGIV